jgi:glutamate-1-semialdehyde 2,1-aminomutase
VPTDEQSPIDGPLGAELWDRADRVLPGGGVYLTRSADMSGRGVLPGFIAQADGCRVTDIDGRQYIDFLGANGPNLLGYRYPEVEAAADAVRRTITTASLFPPQLVDLIEQLVARHESMQWGVAAKNGSEAVSLGARVARQHTQRRGIVAFERAYHGNDAELASGPPGGALSDLTAEVHRLPWNDAEALVQHMDRHGNNVAAVVLNPIDQTPRKPTVGASKEFVRAIEHVRDHWGCLVVFDDVRHGFRLHPEGSYRLLGLEPDLVAYGKALGNGHSVSALLGSDEVRRAVRKILFTSTYMFEAPPMAAAIATLEIYERDSVFDHLTAMGERLRSGLVNAAADAGHAVTLSGPPTMPTLLVADDPDASKVRHFSRAAADAGVIFHPFLNWNLSLAHTVDDIDTAVEAARIGFSAMTAHGD